MRGSLIKPGTTPSHAAAHETGKDRIDARRMGAVSLHTLDGDKTIYVAKSGSDETGDGSEAKPFASIQKAVDMIAPGVWVCDEARIYLNVEAGEYDEDISIEGFQCTSGFLWLNRAKNAVTVRSIEISGSDEVNISGFTIQHTDNAHYGIQVLKSHVKLMDITVIKPHSDGVISYGHTCLDIAKESAVAVYRSNLTGGACGIAIGDSRVTLNDTNISGSERGIGLFSGLLIYGYNNVNTATTQRYIQSGAQIIELSN